MTAQPMAGQVAGQRELTSNAVALQPAITRYRILPPLQQTLLWKGSSKPRPLRHQVGMHK